MMGSMLFALNLDIECWTELLRSAIMMRMTMLKNNTVWYIRDFERNAIIDVSYMNTKWKKRSS